MEDSETAGVRVRIRRADQADAEELTKLVHRFNREHSRLIGGRGMHHESNASTEVQSWLKREDTGYFVAVDSTSGRIVAFRRWELHEGFYFTGPLYVTPDLRRSGVARALIRHVERWLLQKGQDIACISCVPHNRAMIDLARSEGYEIPARTPHRVSWRGSGDGFGYKARDRGTRRRTKYSTLRTAEGAQRGRQGHLGCPLGPRPQQIAGEGCRPNTVELRKNLKKEQQKPRGEVEALGATWKVL